MLAVLPIMGLGLIGLAFGLGLSNSTLIPTQEFAKWLCFGSIMIYLLFFHLGMGPIPWAVNSEIFPLHLRGRGTSMAITTNWLTNYVISQFFLGAVFTPIGEILTFLSFSLICGLCWIFIYTLLPETKGKSIEKNVRVINKIDTKT